MIVSRTAVRSLGLLGLALLATTPVRADEAVLLGGKRFVLELGTWYQEEAGARFPVVTDVVSVRYKPAVADEAKLRLVADERTAVVRQNRIGIVDLEVPAGESPLDFVRRLEATELFEFAEVNTVGVYLDVPSDPLFASQWSLRNVGQTGGTTDADVDAVEAWDLTQGNPAIVVGVLDSGSDIDHVDLSCNVWVNPGEDLDADGVVWDTAEFNGVDDDDNGFVDDVAGWDFFNGNNNPRGPFFHGTHVAGIVGACRGNATGIAGLAGGGSGGPGAKLLVVGVGDNAPEGSILDDSILYATAQGARVITMSLAVGSSSAIDAALAAAGNDGVFIDNASGNAGGAVAYPGTNPHVVAVGATDHNDQRASFSNFGPQLALVAPGVNIPSTQIGNAYGTSSGTSFASPHVAGVAALMLSKSPGSTNQEILDCMTTTAEDQVGNPSQDTPGFDNFYGFGRLNAAGAVACADSAGPGEALSLMVGLSATAPGRVTLSWGPTCTGGASDYAIYSGLIGQWGNHIPLRCTDGGHDLTEELSQLVGSRYFLVVPLDVIREGSYGKQSDGTERPQGTGPCRSLQSVEGCP